MLVSIIVCTHNLDNYQNLIQTIESLLKQTYREIEIVIVVDGNHDLFQKVLPIYIDRSNIKILENEFSLGAFGAGNVGVKVATGDIIAFIDDDAVADTKWLENLVKIYKERNAISVGGKVLPIWLSKQPDSFPEELYWLVGVTHSDFRSGLISEVRNSYGVNMSFKKDVFDKIGYFNAKLGFAKGGASYLQGAEPEFALRMKQRFGKGVLYNPEAIVYHKIPASKTRFGKLIRRAFYQGYSKALMKRFGSLPGTLTTEKSYLRDLLFNYIPRHIDGVFSSHCWREIKRLNLVGSVIISVGIGFLYGYAKGR